LGHKEGSVIFKDAVDCQDYTASVAEEYKMRGIVGMTSTGEN